MFWVGTTPSDRVIFGYTKLSIKNMKISYFVGGSLQLLLCCFTGLLWAQPQQIDLHVSSLNPQYRLSPDQRTLCVVEYSAGMREKYAYFLNLSDFTWQEKRSMNIIPQRTTLSPDFRTVYGNVEDYGGDKGDVQWIPYKKYLAWYFPDARDDTKKMQWSDRFFTLTQLSDGRLLAATGLELSKPKKDNYPEMKIKGLGIVDPTTGEVVQVLHSYPKGKEQVIPHNFRQPISFMIDSDRMMLWTDNGKNFVRLKPATGEFLYFGSIWPVSGYSGKYGMGTGYDHVLSSGVKNIVGKNVVDMETGMPVYETKIHLKNSLGYWVAAAGEHFYTLNGLNSMLCREKFENGKLNVIDSVKLELKGELLYENKWDQNSVNNYKLVVSEVLGKVLMLPASYNQFAVKANPLLVWNLKDGKLIYFSPTFIKPSHDHMVNLKRRVGGPSVLPLNALIKVQNGYYVLLKKDETYKKWTVIKFVRDRNGNYDKVQEQRDLMDFVPVTTEVISSTACSRCSGSGKMAVQKTVTHEKTDKMIYNQITTTTTSNVMAQAVCSDCKGMGFSGGPK